MPATPSGPRAALGPAEPRPYLKGLWLCPWGQALLSRFSRPRATSSWSFKASGASSHFAIVPGPVLQGLSGRSAPTRCSYHLDRLSLAGQQESSPGAPASWGSSFYTAAHSGSSLHAQLSFNCVWLTFALSQTHSKCTKPCKVRTELWGHSEVLDVFLCAQGGLSRRGRLFVSEGLEVLPGGGRGGARPTLVRRHPLGVCKPEICGVAPGRVTGIVLGGQVA